MKKSNGFRKQKSDVLDDYEKNFLETSDAYIAKVKGKKHAIGFLLKSLVVVTTIAVASSFASCTLFGQKNDPEKEPTKTEQTKTDDETNNNNVIVNPGDENQNGENGQNGGNENGEQNGNENGGENNEDPNHNENGGENSGENSGENGNSGENQGENGGENQGENGNENGGQNGNGGENGGDNPENPNPDDPTPDDPKPDDPNPDDPQPEELDFSGLEEKLEEIAAQVQRGASLNELISFSENQGILYFIADITRAGNKRIIIYKAEDIEELSSQEVINEITESLTKNDFVEVVTIQKTSSDITVDDQTYSKDGIEGDNPFARQCGVENAWMTYVSDPGLSDFNSRFETGYSRPVEVLLIYELSGKLNIKDVLFHVESYSGYSNNKIYENLLEEKYEKSVEYFSIGEVLKTQKVADARDWERN